MRLGGTVMISLCALATLAGAGTASAAGNRYAALLAPTGKCGAAADATALSLPTAQKTMLCLTNYARSHAGLQPLRFAPGLNKAANAKLAADLSCHQFSHTPCGKPFESVFTSYLHGANGYSIGENIAWGTGSLGSPRQTMNSWLRSAEHRKNILAAEYRELGVGYLGNQTFQGNEGASLWAQSFGTRTA